MKPKFSPLSVARMLLLVPLGALTLMGTLSSCNRQEAVNSPSLTELPWESPLKGTWHQTRANVSNHGLGRTLATMGKVQFIKNDSAVIKYTYTYRVDLDEDNYYKVNGTATCPAKCVIDVAASTVVLHPDLANIQIAPDHVQPLVLDFKDEDAMAIMDQNRQQVIDQSAMAVAQVIADRMDSTIQWSDITIEESMGTLSGIDGSGNAFAYVR